MDFRAKLARLGDAGPGSAARQPAAEQSPEGDDESPADAERRAAIERLRSMVSGVIARQQREERDRPEGPTLEERIALLPGELRETAGGSVHVLEQVLEPHHCHGRIPVADALDVSPETIAKLALDESLAAIDPRKVLLLDTETTGLSGGTGTIPFLVGLGWFEDESLHLELLFLRRPGEEEPLLRLLAERIAASSCLVTYNGKSFDWPLLRTRYVMNRLTPPELPAHLDLLHAARRVFKRRLRNVKLLQMEAEVLGFLRERDIEGAEVPGIYLDFLRGGDATDMAVVFEHNGNDIVALAAILAVLARRYDELHGEDDPRDHLGFASVAERAGDSDRALAFAAAAAAGGADPSTHLDALLLAARVVRRRRDVDAEEQALQAALEVADIDAPRLAVVHLALAKLYEHRRKDLALALRHARRTAGAESPAAQGRRLGRLTRRLLAAMLEVARRNRKLGATGSATRLTKPPRPEVSSGGRGADGSAARVSPARARSSRTRSTPQSRR